MASETKMSILAIHAGMRFATHEFLHFAKIGIQDFSAIEDNPDSGPLDHHLLLVPLTGFLQMPSLGSRHAISGTMILALVQFGIAGMLAVEHL